MWNAYFSHDTNLVSWLFLGCTDWNSNPVGVSRIQYSSLISNSTREAALSLRGLLTPALFEGVMSYMVWWLCTAWLITSLFGVLYLKTFEASWQGLDSEKNVVILWRARWIMGIVDYEKEISALRKWRVWMLGVKRAPFKSRIMHNHYLF